MHTDGKKVRQSKHEKYSLEEGPKKEPTGYTKTRKNHEPLPQPNVHRVNVSYNFIKVTEELLGYTGSIGYSDTV